MALRKNKTLLDQASDYVDAVRPHVESAIDSAGDFVQKTALPALTDAREKAGPVLLDARDRVTPYLEDARDRAVPVLVDVRAKAAPVVAAGAAAAGSRAAAAKGLADAKVAQLRHEPEPKKRSTLRTLLVLGGVAGAAAFVAKKLQDGGNDPWQSSYTPTPPPAPAGSSPDEALADATGAPHQATTPDDPATSVDLDPGRP